MKNNERKIFNEDKFYIGYVRSMIFLASIFILQMLILIFLISWAFSLEFIKWTIFDSSYLPLIICLISLIPFIWMILPVYKRDEVLDKIPINLIASLTVLVIAGLSLSISFLLLIIKYPMDITITERSEMKRIELNIYYDEFSELKTNIEKISSLKPEMKKNILNKLFEKEYDLKLNYWNNSDNNSLKDIQELISILSK